MHSDLSRRIFNIKDHKDFSAAALEIYDFQSKENSVYRDFINNLKRNRVNSIYDIPFLPVGFFRNHKIITGDHPARLTFKSSGTTGFIPGKHYLTDPALYEESFTRSFRLFYGDPEDYAILAILPSYQERSNSSLIYMVNRLIEKSGYEGSGFYRENTGEMISAAVRALKEKRRVLLLGVSFALLDLAEKHSPDLSGVIVMETGGMKGRRKELTREELHKILMTKFRVSSVHSEYGMTELLSQAYSAGNGIFRCPPWMKILIRDPQDPLTIITEPGRTGGINIIDLANFNSCSFISTADLGKLHRDGSFEVLGRFDNSDIRGCNLLAE